MRGSIITCIVVLCLALSVASVHAQLGRGGLRGRGARHRRPARRPAGRADTAAAQITPDAGLSLSTRLDAARYYSTPARPQKQHCPKGSYLEKDACVPCEEYTAPDDCEDCKPPAGCRHMVCSAGSYWHEGSCQLCPVSTYSAEGLHFSCTACPNGRTTRTEGCVTVEDCVCPEGASGPNCDECPGNMVLLETGQCGCLAGHGGPNCDKCEPGFFSKGGDADAPHAQCTPCGAHLTSPPGAVSAEYCECEAGYGADHIDIPMEERQCVPCMYGTFNPGNAAAKKHDKELYQSASTVSVAAMQPAGRKRRRIRGVPQILPCQHCNARNPYGGFTTLDIGAKSSKQCICKPGHGGFDCEPCEEGSYSLGGKFATCQSCPNNGVGFTTLQKSGATSAAACVCRPGFGMTEAGACKRCPADTYSVGNSRDECSPCPFGTTSAPGAKSAEECHEVAQLCPIGQTAPVGAVSKQECGCYPGYGGGSGPETPCSICPAGTWSAGGNLEACKPCKFGRTSPVGSVSQNSCISVDQCAAGTEIPSQAIGASVTQCRCKAGYGSKTGEGPCHICPVGSFSEGGTLEDCKPCPFGTTSEAGATAKDQCKPVAQKCPVGQIAPPDALSKEQCGCVPGYGGGASPADACSLCPTGTYAPGGNTQPCKPCKFGYTSPAGAVSEDQCYPTNACPAGTELHSETEAPASVGDCVCKAGYGSSSGSSTCQLCPANTYSAGGTLEGCRPCPFGTTSAAGSTSKEQCQNSPQACPIGQWAPEAAVSKEQCICYPGFGAGNSPSDPCTICPPGTFSDGRGLEKCMPCGFGYTSPEGSTSSSDCRPVNQCPAGTGIGNEAGEPDRATASDKECTCKAGYGSSTGTAPCHLCPVGSYSNGGSLEDCKPCPFGTTSHPGTTSIYDCIKTEQACPAGQIAPPDAVSAAQCVCYPGFGGAGKATDACQLCPAGTWSPGNSTDPCFPCGFGFTSPPGSTSQDACYATNACPMGTETHRSLSKASSLADCVCKPGFGAVQGSSVCLLCPAGTYAYGGDMEECEPCPFGTTSAPGAAGAEECKATTQACPAGQSAPPGAVSALQCSCLPGFGGGSKPTDPCNICPAGTWSPGGTTRSCIPCGFGYTSEAGSTDESDCVKVDVCPAGTLFRQDKDKALSIADCVCKPGFGTISGSAGCNRCPAGSFSPGGTMEECVPCPFGTTSPPGAQSAHECEKTTQACPAGQAAPADAVSVEQCSCLPGFGGGDKPSDPCKVCPAGTWSSGGSTMQCIPCGFGYTSAEGSVSEQDCVEVDACPAGTEYRAGVDKAFTLSDCVCKPGFGSVTGSGVCRRCPAGMFSPGGSMEDCKSCGFGYTSKEEAASWKDCRPLAQACPIGQWAPEDAVSDKECRCYNGFGGGGSPSAPCTICPAGTFSANKGTEKCVPCPHGYTSPEGSDDADACHPEGECPTGTEALQDYGGSRTCKCKAGYGSTTGDAPCHLCPLGTFSEGGTMEDCKPCPFGHTSRPGAVSVNECEKVSQPCPIGQIAPPGAVSASQCSCMPGFGGGDKPTDACTICPTGSWSPGGTTERCIPCGFGYTSAEGSVSHHECVEVNACPPGSMYGTDVEQAFSIKDCVCKPGYGLSDGGFCRLCKPGTYSPGGSMESCKSCGTGWQSDEGSISWHDCYQEVDVGSPTASAQAASKTARPTRATAQVASKTQLVSTQAGSVAAKGKPTKTVVKVQ